MTGVPAYAVAALASAVVICLRIRQLKEGELDGSRRIYAKAALGAAVVVGFGAIIGITMAVASS